MKENFSGCFCPMFRDKRNTHSHFLLYLGGKCFDLYKIFRVSLWVITHWIEVKIRYSLLLLTRKHFIKCLPSIVKPIVSQTCKHDVRITSPVAKNIYFFIFLEYLILHKHTVKILHKYKHFPRRYERKREWVFFSEHSVLTTAKSRSSPNVSR